MRRKSLLTALWLWMLGAVFALAPGARADEILVSAAASLTDALNEIGQAYKQTNPQTTVRFNFGASGALQKQIEQGAPVDVFASAAPKEMEDLQQGHHLETTSRIDFAGNRLVLIAPIKSGLKSWDDLRSAAVRRVAISNPASVPSGRYAQETLTKRGLWTLVQPKAVLGENVRQTLTYVAQGDVDAGIVFATDALIEKQKVRIVQYAVPGRDHTPIVYPAAVIAGAPNPIAARRFLTFLQTPQAQGILARYGFTPAHPAVTRRAPARQRIPASRPSRAAIHGARTHG